MTEENEERLEEGGTRRNLVDADRLVPDAVVAARQEADFPTVLLRGYVGEVGEKIKLFPNRTADSWTEIDRADIVGAVQSSGDGESTIIVRRDAKVLYASAGKLSGLAEVGMFGLQCTDDWTGEWECRGGTMYCKVIRRCSYMGGLASSTLSTKGGKPAAVAPRTASLPRFNGRLITGASPASGPPARVQKIPDRPPLTAALAGAERRHLSRHDPHRSLPNR